MPDKADLLEVVCVRPVDGDTAWFEEISGLVVHKVRFIGIDTPETVHPDKPVQEYGPEASAFTKEMLFGKTVWLEYDIEEYDRYARHLCYIWLEDGSLFNLTLIEEGYAVPSIYPPNVKYVEANQFALECLMPSNEYERFIAKGNHSSDSIYSFSREIGVHPAVVIGRMAKQKVVNWHDDIVSQREKLCIGEYPFSPYK